MPTGTTGNMGKMATGCGGLTKIIADEANRITRVGNIQTLHFRIGPKIAILGDANTKMSGGQF